MVYTTEQIDWEVSQVVGNWVKRRNLRKKLTDKSNKTINDRIDTLRLEIRSLKAAGINQQTLSPVYAKITQLEIRLLQ